MSRLLAALMIAGAFLVSACDRPAAIAATDKASQTGGSKVMINYARDHTLKDALDYLAVWQAGMFSPAHMAEAFKAKAEKRDADFPDLVPLRKGL